MPGECLDVTRGTEIFFAETTMAIKLLNMYELVFQDWINQVIAD